MAGGGWTGNGCNGSAVWAVDSSVGQPPAPAVAWKFTPRAGTSQCSLAVFVPARNASGMSEYDVTVTGPGGSQSLGTVSVSQSVAAGSWVTLGNYPVSRGVLKIRLVPGTDPSAVSGGGHTPNRKGKAPSRKPDIAASAASAVCQ